MTHPRSLLRPNPQILFDQSLRTWDLRTRNNIPNTWKMHCQYGQNHILFRYPVHHPLFPRVAVRHFLSLALIVVERNTHWLKNKVWEGDVFNVTLQKCFTFRSCPSKGNSFIFRNIFTFSSKGKLKEIPWHLWKAGFHYRRSRSRSRNQKRRAYNLVKTAFRFRLRPRRLRSVYDLVKTRLS